MALVNCPECGKPVSDRALVCPTCGAPIVDAGPRPLRYQRQGARLKKVGALIVGLLALAIVVMKIRDWLQ